MDKLKIKDIEEYLEGLSKEELKEDIIELLKSKKAIKEYYEDKIYEGYSDFYLDDAKEKVRHEFFPKKGIGRFNFEMIREVVIDYRRMSNNPRFVADLMMYAVENGVDFGNTYGDITDRFYVNMEKLYDETLHYIVRRRLADKFLKRASKIVVETDNNTRGFGANINKIYMKHMEEYM